MAHINDKVGGGIVKQVVLYRGFSFASLYSDVASKKVESVVKTLPNVLLTKGDTVWWDGEGAYLAKESFEQDIMLGPYTLWTPGEV